jgi:glycosyltransferase involved in cell wall biosynthesis
MNRAEKAAESLRILMPCYEFPPIGGGGSRVVDGLSRELVRLGHEVDVVTTRFRGGATSETVDGVNIYRVNCVRLKEHFSTLSEAAIYVAASLRKTRQLVARRGYDINHSHFILPDGFNARRIREATGLPYVITAHGSDVPGYNPHRVRFLHELLTPLWSGITRQASALVCPSRSLQELVAKRDPSLQTCRIPYGFDFGRYRKNDKPQRQILVVTRMLRRKGVQYLLRAVEQLPMRHEVHIVGDGPYLPTLRKLAAQVGAPVTFHGWLDNRSIELTRLYETSDIFVLPSERENFPVALMEAMDAGLAIVTTRGTGCSEVVGDTGVLVEPRDPAGIRSALESLLENPERVRRLGRAARDRLANEFAWPVIARRYIDLYATHRVASNRSAA